MFYNVRLMLLFWILGIGLELKDSEKYSAYCFGCKFWFSRGTRKKVIDLKQDHIMNFNIYTLKYITIVSRSKNVCHSGNLPKLQPQRLKSTMRSKKEICHRILRGERIMLRVSKRKVKAHV